VAAVDEATFRILDILSREMGSETSIRQLTFKIKELYGTGYYGRTYNKLIELSKQELVTISKAGRSSIPSLNFHSYSVVDMLSEIEIRKKREFLEGLMPLRPLIMNIESFAYDDARIESISLASPERNTRLNRAELLILLRVSSESNPKTASIHKTISGIQSRHNIRTDALLLSAEEFMELLTSDEINPVREMLSDKIVIYAPQVFWAEISKALQKGFRIRLLNKETNPGRITESNLVFNLGRFGYRELGPKMEEGTKICIEYIIASILMKREARRINSIQTLVSKNAINHHLMAFLAQKYGLFAELLKILRTTRKTREDKRIAAIIEELTAAQNSADQNSVALGT
jgi:hypothetical protein